jgi:hypothetical protein
VVSVATKPVASVWRVLKRGVRGRLSGVHMQAQSVCYLLLKLRKCARIGRFDPCAIALGASDLCVGAVVVS